VMAFPGNSGSRMYIVGAVLPRAVAPCNAYNGQRVGGDLRGWWMMLVLRSRPAAACTHLQMHVCCLSVPQNMPRQLRGAISLLPRSRSFTYAGMQPQKC
jgi:hypothetical protein